LYGKARHPIKKESKMTLFVKGQDSALIEAELRKASVGDVVSYDKLTSIVGRDVRKQCKASLETARRTLGKEGVWFDVESGVGLKRLDSRGISGAVEGRIQRSRRAAKKSLKMTQAIVLNDLSETDKKKAIAQISQLQAIELFSSTTSQKKIVDKSSSAEPLSLGGTLKLFG
jgi:hypothetical protein